MMRWVSAGNMGVTPGKGKTDSARETYFPQKNELPTYPKRSLSRPDPPRVIKAGQTQRFCAVYMGNSFP
jgi:hypothetical protein